jgi:hypothetical protein
MRSPHEIRWFLIEGREVSDSNTFSAELELRRVPHRPFIGDSKAAIHAVKQIKRIPQ